MTNSVSLISCVRLSVQLFRCDDPDSPHTDHIWEFIRNPGTEYFQIRNFHTGKCVDVRGDQFPQNAVIIQQYTCEPFTQSDTNQWWRKAFE